jgi:hypothetical protein
LRNDFNFAVPVFLKQFQGTRKGNISFYGALNRRARPINWFGISNRRAACNKITGTLKLATHNTKTTITTTTTITTITTTGNQNKYVV